MPKIIVSLSGGMDSATLLGLAHSQGHQIKAIGFTYGSKHNQYENKAAEKLAIHYGVPYQLIDMTSIMGEFKSDLMKTGGSIPEGHYEAKSMERTVVPGRNIIFASILAGIAWSEEASEVWLGIHAGDHAIYPDCRPAFLQAIDTAIQTGTDNRVSIKGPFINLTKADILELGLAGNVPYNLSRTCYKDQEIACGKCGSCQERLASFLENGIEDPVAYESRTILPKE